jgi:hypothetical protein
LKKLNGAGLALTLHPKKTIARSATLPAKLNPASFIFEKMDEDRGFKISKLLI